MKSVQKDNSAPCCPKFDPGPWDKKEILWKDKLFVKGTVPQLWHTPLPGTMVSTVAKMWKSIEKAGAKPKDKDFMMLNAESSPWKGEIFINSTKTVPGAQNVDLSGTYYTWVFDGPYNATPRWVKRMNQYMRNRNKKALKYYFHFTTCPRCAKIYGHNYAVAFAKVQES
jgi:hypothetical protein